MKRQRLRFRIIAFGLFLLFGILAAFGTYSVLAYGNRWFSSRWNTRVRAQKENVAAGDILDRAGIVLATTKDGQRIYQADEEARRAVVHVVGDREGQVSNAVETFQTNYLYGFRIPVTEMISNLISGSPNRGDTVQLTIDSHLCVEISRAFQSDPLTKDRRGAAVVLNYRTGEILAIVSLPSFDPDHITESDTSNPGQPFWNRATQGTYPPGSTFKIITAAAAIDSIDGILDSNILCNGGLAVGGQRISDWNNEVHGQLSFRQAFAASCNNVFALAAINTGSAPLLKAAQSFGFNDNFLFRDLVVENSAFPTGQLSQFDLAISGFGQGRIAATPMHMCMVAAAVGNGGVMMEPRLLRSVQSASGHTRLAFSSSVYKKALGASDAGILQDFMRYAVVRGTGSRASVPGMSICGKTGTAESVVNNTHVNYGWFIGFAADPELPVAVSVLIENIDDGTGGGATAAPIAGKIFAYIKQNAARVIDPGLPEDQPAATSLFDAAQAFISRLTATASPIETVMPEETPMPTITPTPAPTSVIDTVRDIVQDIEQIRDILTGK